MKENFHLKDLHIQLYYFCCIDCVQATKNHQIAVKKMVCINK